MPPKNQPLSPMFAPQWNAPIQNALDASGTGMSMPAPQQNMLFSNQAVAMHPALMGVANALGTLANMGPTSLSAGDNISNFARGVVGNMMQNRQFQYQQAMLPLQMAQQLAQLRMQTAPQAIKTDAGIVYRDPMTGAMAPGLSNMQIAKMNDGQSAGRTNLHDQLHGLMPDADPRESAAIDSLAQTANGFYDPQKQAEYVQKGMEQLWTQRNQRNMQQAQLTQSWQAHLDSMHEQDLTRGIAQENADLRQREFNQKLQELTPEAQSTIVSGEATKQQISDLRQRLQSLKGSPGWNVPGYFFGRRALYAMGFGGDEAKTWDDMSNFELNTILGQARIARLAGSRNFRVMEEAQKHLPNMWRGSPKQIDQQLSNLYDNVSNMSNDAYTYGKKYQPMAPSGFGAPAPNAGSGNGFAINTSAGALNLTRDANGNLQLGPQ